MIERRLDPGLRQAQLGLRRDDRRGKYMSFSIPKSIIDACLTNPPAEGKNTLEPLKSLAREYDLPINILEDTNVVNKVEVHVYESDIWLCLEGEAKFLLGGKMVDQYDRIKPDGTVDDRELRAKALSGAKEIILKPGDWLWIPAGEPHQHGAEGTARLVIIKIPSLFS